MCIVFVDVCVVVRLCGYVVVCLCVIVRLWIRKYGEYDLHPVNHGASCSKSHMVSI